MADDSNINELVRVRIGDVEKNMGRVLAESSSDVTILDESIWTPDGRLRDETGRDGRPLKPKTSVATEVAAKKTAASAETKKESAK